MVLEEAWGDGVVSKDGHGYVLGNKFSVKVGVHQGSVLSPLLFIIVLEARSSECRNRSVWELLHADDLVIIAKSL